MVARTVRGATSADVDDESSRLWKVEHTKWEGHVTPNEDIKNLFSQNSDIVLE